MSSTPTLGQKIKSFRKRAGMSQLELETSLGLAEGHISRIESGKVNPTRETLIAIANQLQLRPAEIIYLMGIANTPPTEREISTAIDHFRDFLSNPSTYAYLLDQYSRILVLSEGFEHLLKANKIHPDKLIGRNVIEILFLPELGVRKLVNPKSFEEVALPALAVMHQEREHLLSEPGWQRVLNNLQEAPDFQRLWEQSKQEEMNLYLPRSRTVTFRIMGLAVPMVYYLITFHLDPRFLLIEYVPDLEKMSKAARALFSGLQKLSSI